MTRLTFFASFCLKAVADHLINFLLATPKQGGYAPDEWAKEACKWMDEASKSELEAEHDGTCQEIIEGWIFYSMLGWILIVSVPITVHFALVLYSHWREAADEEKGEGGSGEEDEEPLMD